MADTNGSQNSSQNSSSGNRGGSGDQDRTFTQAELDSIVGERLSRERQKYADYEDLKTKAAEYDKQQEASKTELQKAQDKAAKLQAKVDSMEKAGKIRDIRDRVSRDTGVPAELLSGEDEEACKAQAESILKFARGSKYPGVKGEKHEAAHRNGGMASDATSEDYKELAGQIFGRKE